MQCACAVLSSVPCPAVHIFPHYLISGRIFREKAIVHKMCSDFISNFGMKHF